MQQAWHNNTRGGIAACAVAVLLVVAMPVSAAEVYRSVDANGNPIFTDQPAAGQQRIEIAPPTVVNIEANPQMQKTRPAKASETTVSPFVPYKRFAIVSPGNEETIPTGAAGDVQVELAISPDLASGDKVRLLVDGQVSQSALRTTAFLISNMDRGEHHLRAELVDAAGNMRQQSEAVTIYVQRASRNMPANPNRPSSHP